MSTDSTKYPDYFSRTDRRGQNITLDGFVQSPNSSGFSKSDSLYYFDLNFESTDLWVIPFIAPNLFTEMSGVATGSGSILGGWDDYDFTINYDIGLDDAVYFRPKFLDTYYYGVGNIIFNREDGLIFNDVFVILLSAVVFVVVVVDPSIEFPLPLEVVTTGSLTIT